MSTSDPPSLWFPLPGDPNDPASRPPHVPFLITSPFPICCRRFVFFVGNRHLFIHRTHPLTTPSSLQTLRRSIDDSFSFFFFGYSSLPCIIAPLPPSPQVNSDGNPLHSSSLLSGFDSPSSRTHFVFFFFFSVYLSAASPPNLILGLLFPSPPDVLVTSTPQDLSRARFSHLRARGPSDSSH